ncbi:hypothetical protein LRAMOSA06835 [Lichtheimia ramosa]|uniref:BHLH domain-containing protein n=1 Tax=Lichtheimia ramosa TaxID=688394 RepID=A0A077WAU4_9FUNG|nr:hypothetical protein LRAMOSA06835 [Lichtheimia ramosa]
MSEDHSTDRAAMTDTLFSDLEQRQLQSFLSGFDKPSSTASSSSPPPTSPMPIMLSSPYNTTQFSGGQINVLPLPETSSSTGSSSQPNNAQSSSSSSTYQQQQHSPSSSSSNSGAREHPRKVEKRKYDAQSAASSKSSGTRTGRGRKPPHELLSEAQKKANHIASEQKRRANIRIGFDQLVDMVPTLSHSHRSESVILQKSAEYIRQLVSNKNSLRERVRELQTALGDVPDEDSSEGEMDYPF